MSSADAPKRVAKGCSLNRKGMIKRGIFEHQKERKNIISKILVTTTDFPSPFEFSKLYLKVGAKMITLPEVVLSVCRGNIKGNCIINRER